MLPPVASLLVPGLGQFIAGRRARGIAIFAVVLTMVALVAWWSTPPQVRLDSPIPGRDEPGNANWLILIGIVWLWNVWDAVRPGRPGWIPIAAAALLFYAVGWQAIGGNVGLLAQNIRRTGQIVGPMLRPDLVQPRAEVRELWVPLLVPCPAELPSPSTNATEDGSMTLSLAVGCAAVGDTIQAAGAGFWPDIPAKMIWQSPIRDLFPLRHSVTKENLTATVDSLGNLTAAVVVPLAIPPGRNPNLPDEQRLYIRQSRSIGGIELSLNGNFVVKGLLESIAIAIMSTTFGAVLALPLSFLAARNLMSANRLTKTIYYGVRTLLNIVRSIEALIIAIIFVNIVGLGPFAGMLAITIHTVAALGKLFSEVVEGIDPGPIEAIHATGASWLQLVRYAVAPQIVVPFTSFTIYRLEINVRTATIVGFVGGGGIGFFLVQWIQLSDYRAVGAALFGIFLVVSAMDFISARIRARLV